ncbi:MAG: ribonucleotide reductase subunit alpha [Eggerthellaceae bacterium]|nr:ribonucleotide reductase subunit alpha [Eggerthellaceae bacterium]
MAEHANETPNQNNCDNQATDYLGKAADACAAGDYLLGMHLYLAAYEKAAADADVPTSVEVSALREAWHLACDLKERSMAEYVFEKLEPFLTGEEIAECAMKLQELALDRLEQYGFSREDLEDMAESISQDFLGDGAHVVKVESVSIPNMNMFGVPNTTAKAAVVEQAPQVEASAEASDQQPEVPEQPEAPEAKPAKPPHVDMGVADVDNFNPYDMFYPNSVGTSYHAATNEGSGAYIFTRDEDRAHALERAEQEAAEAQEQEEAPVEEPVGARLIAPDSESEPAAEAPKVDLAAVASIAEAAVADAVEAAAAALPDNGPLSFQNLAGYDDAISIMRDLGVGVQNDPAFNEFVRMMNVRHGLDRMPAVDTLLFRAPVLEDASRFAEATAGELGLPVLHMAMEEGMGGVPVLCVTTQGNNRPRMNHAHNRFEGPGILVIEDLDAWALPEVPDSPEGIGGFMMANISRGAREAVNLIRSAVEDPDVYVLVTSTTTSEVDPFFYELLEPITVVDIGLPNEKERADIWKEIALHHPSMRGVTVEDLVRFSDGLARYDMYMAAREAVEDAYKTGLVQRAYLPVTPQNLFDKLAACQPLDSDRYRELEQAVIDDFRSDLDHLEDLLGGQE